jgi:cysteinyl-tRNA synthetase
MPLKLHNTLTARLEEFVPLHPPKVGMYVCGVTVYDRSHIGHARAMVTFDVLYRYLRFSGYDVHFVRNFTDVDDKIIIRAQKAGVPAIELAEANIRSFAEDVKVLGCARPSLEPRATEHIPQMLALIQTLIDKGLAYPAGGDVYFAVDKFEGYGKLSKRKLEDMVAGSRIEVDERKHHPMDFALWKASKPGEPKWESPWGPGRPGWHIECSAMALEHLGQPFDIHGGGTDLIFPHHENEIAQSEGARDCAFARYWVHNGMVSVGQEKMSKSLGNFLTVQEASQRVGGEGLRFYTLGTHYRSPLEFTPERLDDAARGLGRIYETLARADAASSAPASAVEADAEVMRQFREAMDDDLNTARVIGILFETVRAINRELDAKGDVAKVVAMRRAIADAGEVLGVCRLDPAEYLAREKRDHLADSELSAAQIEDLIADRAAARKSRDFKRADQIRDELKAKGVLLDDSPAGTTWRVER